jgi:RimJ/RimL family protein N-acetyltransferase
MISESLTTSRLVLRRPRGPDAGAIFAYASDPAVTRFMSFHTHSSLEDTLAFLAGADEGWAARTDMPFVIERQGMVIGSTGLHCEAPHRFATGYVLRRDCWGFGYATEALRAMLELAFSLRDTRRVYALCEQSHLASARVMEKAGMSREGVLRAHSVLPNLASEPRDMLCYARVRE